MSPSTDYTSFIDDSFQPSTCTGTDNVTVTVTPNRQNMNKTE